MWRVLLLLVGALSLRVNDTVWDPQEATDFAKYSFAAYCPDSSIMDRSCWYCDPNTRILGTKKHTHCETYVGVSEADERIVVVFRGTDNMRNWLQDANILPKKAQFGGHSVLVHQGFLDSYRALRDYVLKQVKHLRELHPDFTVYLTGHSLGGAQATLMALDLSYNHDMEDLFVYSFGSPRIGDNAFANLFNKRLGDRHWRVVHYRDVVPHNPSSSIGYRHVAREVLEHNGYKVCKHSGEDKHCSAKYWRLSAKDHSRYMHIPTGKCSAKAAIL